MSVSESEDDVCELVSLEALIEECAIVGCRN
jgi:hypothetical protein